MAERSHYPDYDLLAQQSEWDALTREIVQKRLGPFPPKQSLTDSEERDLRLIAQHLLYDNRENILDWIIHHIDQDLTSGIGESQRKPTTPPMAILLKDGLQAIHEAAHVLHGQGFDTISTEDQFSILASLQLQQAADIPRWTTIPQKELFNKLLELMVTAYYSHPLIWQEIGHGGPAYPRGYYRIELGWTDPWEAQPP